jgi:hypothetical protein
MGTQGVFGYIIGKKKRMTHVQYDADMLWQILVREIYVLMKYYKTKEELQEAFKKIKVAKNNPKQSDIEKCKCFTDMEVNYQSQKDWYCLLRYCQSSFINTLEAGYIINQPEYYGYIFILDFNKGIASFTKKDNPHDKPQCLCEATIEEILEFDEMPTKSYTEIVTEMKTNFDIYYEKYSKIQKEIDKIEYIINDAKRQGAANIEEKAQLMLDNVKWDQKKLNMERRVFYNRLKALDLFEDDTNNEETCNNQLK